MGWPLVRELFRTHRAQRARAAHPSWCAGMATSSSETTPLALSRPRRRRDRFRLPAPRHSTSSVSDVPPRSKKSKRKPHVECTDSSRSSEEPSAEAKAKRKAALKLRAKLLDVSVPEREKLKLPRGSDAMGAKFDRPGLELRRSLLAALVDPSNFPEDSEEEMSLWSKAVESLQFAHDVLLEALPQPKQPAQRGRRLQAERAVLAPCSLPPSPPFLSLASLLLSPLAPSLPPSSLSPSPHTPKPHTHMAQTSSAMRTVVAGGARRWEDTGGGL